jgi:hypothetical protein
MCVHKKRVYLLSNEGRHGRITVEGKRARTLISTLAPMRTKDPRHAYVYTRVRNPVPDDKLTSRTERLRVGLPRFISVTYNGERRVWGARFERTTQ